MSETDNDYLDAILSTRRTDSAPTTTMDLPTSKLPFDYFPETPSTLTGDLFSPSTVTRLAFLAGGISIRVRDKARQVLPRADIPSLLRDLRYTLIEHQYQTWIERNEVQPRGLHKPSYDKPKGPPKAPSPPPHHTHHPCRPTRRGSDGAERITGPATDGPGSVNALSGRPSQIDPDLHANPTRHNGSDNARPPPTDDTSDADQAPSTKQATAKDKPEPRQYFSLYLFHTT